MINESMSKADRILWKWSLGELERLPVERISPASPKVEADLRDWAFEKRGGQYVRATLFLNVVRRRALVRARAGFLSGAGNCAAAELARIVLETSGGKSL